MTVPEDWLDYTTFILEGVLLLCFVCIGLTGNVLSFIVLITQKVQRTFHNLLLLLNIFDMVGVSKIIVG